jgi:hypothetical protein
MAALGHKRGDTAPLPLLRVVGVPEHFNFPWTLAIKEKLFESAGLRVEFTSCPGGTGAMLQSVVAGDAEVAVALTEGIVAGVVNQEDSATQLRYCGQYVVREWSPPSAETPTTTRTLCHADVPSAMDDCDGCWA